MDVHLVIIHFVMLLVNMKWLLEKGCVFDEDTFNCATEHGDLENIDWLIANGCPQY